MAALHTTKPQLRWKASHPEKVKEYSSKTKKRHPERHAARSRIAHAIRAGKLVRPAECEDCGRYDGWHGQSLPKIEAHHLDYSKPLDIEWLCKECHDDLKVAA